VAAKVARWPKRAPALLAAAERRLAALHAQLQAADAQREAEEDATLAAGALLEGGGVQRAQLQPTSKELRASPQARAAALEADWRGSRPEEYADCGGRPA
jgi:hypothetical protein